jgi:hypothetical protein
VQSLDACTVPLLVTRFLHLHALQLSLPPAESRVADRGAPQSSKRCQEFRRKLLRMLPLEAHQIQSAATREKKTA